MSDLKVVDSKILLARDFSSTMEWSINKIPKITSDWTDFSITAPEMIWLATACYSYDMLNYMLDKKYLNNQIRFSNSFNNILNMCTLRGVTIPGALSSKTLININFSSSGLPALDEVELSKGSTFGVFDSVTLKTLVLNVDEDYTLSFGDNLISCSEGVAESKTLLRDDFTSIGTYVLDTESIGLNTVKVTINNVEWRIVADAALITDNVNSYSVHVHNNNHTLLKLTPGFFDEIGTNDIEITYLVTSGSNGNLSTYLEVEPDFKFIDSYGKNVTKSMTFSVTKSSGGSDLYSLEDARSLLGTTSSDVITLVTTADYEDVVKQLDYVYGCTVQDEGNIKNIYYVADKEIGSYSVTDSMIISNITEAISEKVPAFTQFTVHPIVIRPVSMKITVFLNRNELDVAGLRDKIENYLMGVFDRKVVKTGTELNRNALAIGIEDLSYSVSHVLFEYPRADIYCNWNEIVELDNILINFERG